jgi:hypothetical protein
MKQETVQGKRIGKVVGIAMEIDRMINDYETFTSDLLKWIETIFEWRTTTAWPIFQLPHRRKTTEVCRKG